MRLGSANKNAAADRAETIRSNMAREDQMKANLGLQERQLDLASQAQSFQQDVWRSQADMRSVQYDLAKNNLQTATDHLKEVQSGQPILNSFISGLHTKPATELLNATIPEGLTMEQQEQATRALAAARGTQSSMLAADTITQQQQAKVLLQRAGKNPDEFVDPNTGLLNMSKVGNALTTFEHGEMTFKSDLQEKVAKATSIPRQESIDHRQMMQSEYQLLNNYNSQAARLEKDPLASSASKASARAKAQQQTARIQALNEGQVGNDIPSLVTDTATESQPKVYSEQDLPPGATEMEYMGKKGFTLNGFFYPAKISGNKFTPNP